MAGNKVRNGMMGLIVGDALGCPVQYMGRISKVKDLYASIPNREPGWYAVWELFEKIV